MKERYLLIQRSQIFKIIIPEEVSNEKVKEMLMNGEMYDDAWNELFSGDEELYSDYGDDWIDLVDNDETTRIITF